MKKLFSFIALFAILLIGASKLNAQTANAVTDTTVKTDTVSTANQAGPADEQKEGKAMHEVFKEQFIAGGVPWMTPILIILIIGLALVIERIIYLNLATTNTTKLLSEIEGALEKGGIEAAKEVCRNTRGPVASIFYQGLDRASEGVEMAEKAVISYGSVQAGLLEKGLTWISLFIALAPMLGFLGTVVGMVMAFRDIEAAGDISPTLVAGGIKVALLTTVFGLIVAMILQVFYNYLLNKIDSIVNSMEDASISLIDILVKYNLKNK